MRASALLLACLLACRPPAPEIDPRRPLPSPEELRAAVQKQADLRRTLRALGRVTYFGPEGRVRLKMVVAAQRPSSIRIETLSPLEQPIEVMVSDGQRMSLLGNGRLREGPATAENVGRILPFPMDAASLVDLMLGGIPLSAFEATDVKKNDNGMWILVLHDRGMARPVEVTVDPNTFLVVEARLGDLSIRFDDFEEVGTLGAFARKLEVVSKERDLDVKLQFQELDLNETLSPELFVIRPPPGVIPELLPSPPIRLPVVDTSTSAKWQSSPQAE